MKDIVIKNSFLFIDDFLDDSSISTLLEKIFVEEKILEVGYNPNGKMVIIDTKNSKYLLLLNYINLKYNKKKDI